MAETNPSLRSRWGHVVDYFFGRNALIGVASFMLLLISGYATWHGMSDFIIGVSSSAARRQQELPGGLSFSTHLLIIVIVVALTFLMWLALRETFGAKRRFLERIVTAALYVFLMLWSVGFGYGFWWSLIAGEEATRASLSGLQEDARDAVSTIAARLDAVRIELDSVVSWSDSQMTREAGSGGTCGTASGAGRGPLFGARQGVRDSVAALRDNISKSWLNPIKGDLEQLSTIAAELQGATIEERQRLFEATAADLRGRARNIAARSNALGQSTAAEMRALGDALAIAPGEKGFSCYDPTLAQRLKRTAAQAEEPAILHLRSADFNEGPAGVANAIKSLWANVGTYLSSLGSYVASGGKVVVEQTASDTRITGRDLIALLATLGTDLGLFALTLLNPPQNPPSLRPPGTVIRQINAALQTAIARAPGADLEWVRRHFIHHNKASYFIIPNLHSIDPGNEDESSKALAMNQLAGVLSDLDLARWPRSRELKRLRREETVRSETDLRDIREKWNEETRSLFDRAGRTLLRRGPRRLAMRNHGLFSKAECALQIAGWSQKARNDIEIFRLVDSEGLTPLLMVLNEANVPAAARSAQTEPVMLAGSLGTIGAGAAHHAPLAPTSDEVG